MWIRDPETGIISDSPRPDGRTLDQWMYDLVGGPVVDEPTRQAYQREATTALDALTAEMQALGLYDE